MTTQKILITSALPYVNNVPHLGNIIGAVLSADVFARYCRSRGKETLYICGTDEHGTATETKALEEGVTPKEICDKYHALHKEIYEWFNISFDAFGRTSTEEQKEITQHIFLKLKENGFIVEDEVEQLYCPSKDMFLADRFVEGTCPFCKYEDARGDQCDKCGRILNSIELINPRSKVCPETPVIKKSKHLFLDLPKLERRLLEWTDSRSVAGKWSANAKSMTYAWIKEGLQKRAISRDLKWGVPIPMKGYEHKVFYVWFDAPIGYLSITKHAFPDSWKDWWYADDKVKLYQFMGKDNVPFHTIIFPSSLLGTGEPYTMLHRISSTEYLNYEDGKFSKSRNIGVFGTDAKDTGIDVDVFRYYLLINRPEKSDSAFLWQDLLEKNNNELVATFGNLINRTMVFLKKYFEGKTPDIDLQNGEELFYEQLRAHYAEVSSLLDDVEIKEALKKIMHIAKLGNQFFQESAPWKTIKEDPEAAARALYVLANLSYDLAVLISPYLPSTSQSIFSQLRMESQGWHSIGSMAVPRGHGLAEPQILFTKLDEKLVDELKDRYSGKKEFPIRLQVAKILSADVHPDSDRLLVLQIDLGEEQRQLVAGIREHYSCEALVGRKIVIVANLQPAELRGKLSQGMLLAASKGKTLELVGTDAKVGTLVAPVGHDVLQDEITIDDFAKHKLLIHDKRLMCNGRILKARTGETVGADITDGAKVR